MIWSLMYVKGILHTTQCIHVGHHCIRVFVRAGLMSTVVVVLRVVVVPGKV